MNTDSLKRLWKTVFGDSDAFIDTFFDIAYSPDRCRYTAENGEAVSALYWFDCEHAGRKLAYIYAVATDPGYRGKGLASRLLTQTHEALKQQGYSGAVLKPANGLFPFYERLGYATCGFVSRFQAAADHSPIPVKPLDTAEYAALRRQFLPQDAVIQEGVTLDFLGSFASFYAAEDALLCAAPEDGVIVEFLGDPTRIPGILAALGMKTAHVTIPGDEIPFVMYFPLDDAPAPGYLGITLE